MTTQQKPRQLVPLTRRIAVDALEVARHLVLERRDGLGVNGVPLARLALVRLVALKRVQDLLLDGRDPLVPLLLAAGLEVPLLVVEGHQAELVAVGVCNEGGRGAISMRDSVVESVIQWCSVIQCCGVI